MLERREHTRFRSLPSKERAIVFYSEGEEHWQHLRPIVEYMTNKLGRNICYVTSSETDPILGDSGGRIRAFYIGKGVVRTSFFMKLAAKVMVMTMPDLQTFHIKRSKVSPVHYVYVFHSIISTHMIYREKAFDNFDTILTVGPHHESEIRATEEEYGLNPKILVSHGSGRLDTIIRESRDRAFLEQPIEYTKANVLVAPSWGPHGLIESCGAAVAEILLEGGFNVIFRPHPRTGQTCPQAIAALKEFEGRDGFRLELDISGQESMYTAHVMISDWSGSALEYAFGLERPVIFIDVPRKVNNPAYKRIGLIPLEVSIRWDVGEVVTTNELSRLPQVINRLCSDPEAFRERIRVARQATVYNIGSSGKTGAAAIDAIVNPADRSVLAKRNDTRKIATLPPRERRPGNFATKKDT